MSIDSVVAEIPTRDIPRRLKALADARTQFTATGGSSTAFHTAVADTLTYLRMEAQEAGQTTDAENTSVLLFEFNKGIALDFSHRFHNNSGNHNEDYEQAAYLGLWQAVATYVPGMGSFSSWAYRLVRKSVSISVRACEFPVLSQGEFEKRPRVIRARNELGAGAEMADIAHRARVTPTMTERILNPPNVASIDKTLRSSENLTLGDTLPDKKTPHSVLLEETINNELYAALADKLTTEEFNIVSMIYGLSGAEPISFYQVARVLKVKENQVRETHSECIEKLRAAGLGEWEGA